jgi:hypothetical protein
VGPTSHKHALIAQAIGALDRALARREPWLLAMYDKQRRDPRQRRIRRDGLANFTATLKGVIVATDLNTLRIWLPKEERYRSNSELTYFATSGERGTRTIERHLSRARTGGVYTSHAQAKMIAGTIQPAISLKFTTIKLFAHLGLLDKLQSWRHQRPQRPAETRGTGWATVATCAEDLLGRLHAAARDAGLVET